MKYQVKVNLFFDNKSDASAVFDAITELEAKTVNINDDTVGRGPERSSFEYIKCYHDDEVIKPCEIIKKTVKQMDGSLEKIDNSAVVT